MSDYDYAKALRSPRQDDGYDYASRLRGQPEDRPVDTAGMAESRDLVNAASMGGDSLGLAATNVEDDQSYVGGLARAAVGGQTLNFADEAGAVAATQFAALNPADDLDIEDSFDTFGGILKTARQMQDDFRESNPWSAGIAEFGGGFLTGGSAGATAAKSRGSQSLLNRLLSATGTGAVTGGVAGAGAADEGDLMSSVGWGTTLGGLFGGALGLAVPVGGSILNALGRDVTRSNKGNARRIVGQMANETGLTEKMVRDRIEELGPDATLMDLNDALVGLAQGVAVKSPRAKALLAEYLERRQKGARERVRQMFSEAYGKVPPGFYATMRQNLERLQQRVDQENYPPIMMQAIDGTNIDPLLRTPLARKAQKEGEAMYLSDPVNPMEELPEVKTLAYYDTIKEALWDMEDALRQKGKKRKANRVGDIRRDLVARLDAQVPGSDVKDASGVYRPGYAKARGAHERIQKLLDASKLGRSIWRITSPEKWDELVDEQWAYMSPAQRESFRIGAMASLDDKIRNSRPGQNMGNTFAGELADEKIALLSITDEAAEKLFTRLQGEEVMNETISAVSPRKKGGSRSMYGLTAGDTLTNAVDTGSTIISAAGGSGKAVGQIVTKFLQGELPEETMMEIAQILVQRGHTQQEINRMMRTGQVSQPMFEDIAYAMGIAGGVGPNAASLREPVQNLLQPQEGEENRE